MSEPADPRQLDPAQARRLLSAMSLRPSERVLCLGPEGGALGGVAAILVGPTGHIEEADPAAAAGETLPYPDDGFDAVVIDLTTPHPEQSHLLTEVARVTAPTGRVAFAMPRRANGNPEPVQQLADAAGLRGVATRSDPAADSESEPIEFVTAFPPLPASAYSPTTMVRRPKPAGQPGRRRSRLLVTAAALVVAAAAGVAWGLAGAGPGDDALDGGSGPLAGDTELDIDQLGAEGQLATKDAPAGGELPTDNSGGDSNSSAASGNGSGSGSSSDTNGGGGPDNRAPVIEDLRFYSNGLALSLDPVVRDPDGDQVSVTVEVDGEPVPMQPRTGEEAAYEVLLLYSEVGEQHDASVTVTATDDAGASSQQTETYRLIANTRVTVRQMRFTVLTPDCFGEVPAQRLTGTVRLGAPVNVAFDVNEELRRDRSDVVLREHAAGAVAGSAELEVSANLTFAGETTTYRQVWSSNQPVRKVFHGPGDCRALLTYQVDFEPY